MTALHEAARGYLHVPFFHQGRSRSGLDCVGLVVSALNDCGHSVSDFSAYGRNPYQGQLEDRLCAVLGQPIDKSAMAPGDVVAIDFAGVIRHVGIVGEYPDGGLSLIHTCDSVGRVTEHRIDKKWDRRIKKVWRPAEGGV